MEDPKLFEVFETRTVQALCSIQQHSRVIRIARRCGTHSQHSTAKSWIFEMKPGSYTTEKRGAMKERDVYVDVREEDFGKVVQQIRGREVVWFVVRRGCLFPLPIKINDAVQCKCGVPVSRWFHYCANGKRLRTGCTVQNSGRMNCIAPLVGGGLICGSRSPISMAVSSNDTLLEGPKKRSSTDVRTMERLKFCASSRSSLQVTGP